MFSLESAWKGLVKAREWLRPPQGSAGDRRSQGWGLHLWEGRSGEEWRGQNQGWPETNPKLGESPAECVHDVRVCRGTRGTGNWNEVTIWQ